MRSSNNYRNGSNISRMVIKEETEEDIDRHPSRTRMDPYALSSSGHPIHFSKTSIIRTHHGKRNNSLSYPYRFLSIQRNSFLPFFISFRFA